MHNQKLPLLLEVKALQSFNKDSMHIPLFLGFLAFIRNLLEPINKIILKTNNIYPMVAIKRGSYD
jgi:hypothetical protein